MDNGGPAFPHSEIGGDVPYLYSSGMSLRDYFAGQALIGLCGKEGHESNFDYARFAYQFADAMLAEREKENS